MIDGLAWLACLTAIVFLVHLHLLNVHNQRELTALIAYLDKRVEELERIAYGMAVGVGEPKR